MEKLFTSKMRIGEIVAEFPKSTDILMEYNIDFCCGGDRPLALAIKEQNLDEKELLSKLNNAYKEFKLKDKEEIDWRTESMTKLIDYVVNTHHQFMRDELPRLNELLNRILSAHYTKHGELLAEIHKLFYQLRGEIEEHLIKEEKLLFPVIKEYEKNRSQDKLREAFEVMYETEEEHDQAGDILKEIRRLTNNYKLPSSACKTFELTYKKFESVEGDLFQHIHLENNILFERLKKENKN
ncbi:iron-sulfur cluster repair di-iron protein [Orenia marismortui]|uniref:Regulator of cell morphogenesis and NO signaling n=1 Tax=Orenia marismortui TaxID=46469 RepID=A0A4R8GRB7_9FIRM|nr:iron-sulfur cluster repair di-iron protein [Orenia marismortui]TDX48362.1 regulator of cell morphogenesis and NO signaling [Orenia marismortui]